MGDFRMPSLGADMEAGTLIRWMVQPGDTVHRGEVVALVDTEKTDIEVEVFEDGVVEELVVGAGEKVPVGTLLARLRPVDAAAAAPAAEVPEVAAAAPPEQPAPTGPLPSAAPAAGPTAATAPLPAPPSAVLRSSPAARARARELGLELATIAGRGPGGAVTLADVLAAAAARQAPAAPLAEAAAPAVLTPVAPPAPAPPPASGLRRALAAAMERSNREIPHYYLSTEIDLSRALAWLAGENSRRPAAERLLPAALLLKATALALREVPELNGFWIEGAFRPGQGIHLGVAVSRKGGEVVIPALHDVDRLPLPALMAALADLVRRARSGSLRSSEVADATLTVTNLGDLGADSVLGVIYPPQVALVGFGRIRERPWAEGGILGVRPLVVASLAADHRASDGYRGGRFLAGLGTRLQEPEEL